MFDGHTFKAYAEHIDGHLLKNYFIDSISVDAQDYYRRLQEAHEAELEQSLDQQIINNQKDIGPNYVRTLRHVCNKIESIINTIKQFGLEPYLVFNDETIDSLSDWHHLADTLTPSLIFCQDPGLNDIPPILLEKFIRAIEQLAKRVQKLYQTSLQNALDHVDNPAHLKQLLELKTQG